MQKIFVTGGAGFIGSHLVDILIAKKYSVTVYDNFSSGKEEFIRQHFSNPAFAVVKADLLDLERLKKEINGHELVFHLSANPDARWGIDDTTLDLKQETIATYNVLEAMRLNNIKQIVFSSSGTIYGETPIIPLPEEYGPVLPISLYGAGKLASEGLISAFCGTFGFRAWIFRFANVVGPRATHGVIYDFLAKLQQNPYELKILGNGTQCKPYLHVKDCVAGMLFAYKNAQEQLNVFNLGCDTATNVAAIAGMLLEEMGLENVTFKFTGGDRGWPGDVPQVRFNTEKMKKLGWAPRYSSDEAVRQAIKDIIQDKGRQLPCK